MKHGNIVIENIDVLPDRFDTIIERLLIGLMIFMPLTGGARQAWSEQIVVTLSIAVVITFLVKMIFQKSLQLSLSAADHALN